MWHHLRNAHKMELPISTEVYGNMEIDIENEVDIEFMKDLVTEYGEHEICERERTNQKINQIRTFFKFIYEKNLVSRKEKHYQILKLETI